MLTLAILVPVQSYPFLILSYLHDCAYQMSYKLFVCITPYMDHTKADHSFFIFCLPIIWERENEEVGGIRVRKQHVIECNGSDRSLGPGELVLVTPETATVASRLGSGQQVRSDLTQCGNELDHML